MLCERCKIREANVRYTEIMNGVKTEHNLCMQCAGEMNLGQGGFVVDGDMTIGMHWAERLKSRPSKVPS